MSKIILGFLILNTLLLIFVAGFLWVMVFGVPALSSTPETEIIDVWGECMNACEELDNFDERIRCYEGCEQVR